MGGALILLVHLPSARCSSPTCESRVVWVALLMTFGYGFIGFLDDWLKLSKRNSKGLAGPQEDGAADVLLPGRDLRPSLRLDDGGRLLAPTLLIDTRLTLPFIPTHWFNPDLGWVYVLFGWFVVVGTSQRGQPHRRARRAGHRAHHRRGDHLRHPLLRRGHHAATRGRRRRVDGVPKLVGMPLYEYLGIAQGAWAARSSPCSAPRSSGAGIAFLWFNTYPASVFMGDVGSLALGGALGGLAVLSQERGGLARSSTASSSPRSSR